MDGMDSTTGRGTRFELEYGTAMTKTPTRVYCCNCDVDLRWGRLSRSRRPLVFVGSP